MKKCLICNKNNADKTGSHIVPHFLLKRIDNEEGSNKRDKEMGFSISEKNLTSYFGRSTSVEKLEEIYGEISNERIQNNTIPLIEDYILCSSCEKRLGEIENKYSDSLKNGGEPNSNYANSEDSFLPFIFWVSIIWRLSIAENSGFKLSKENENQIQNILAKFLHCEEYVCEDLKGFKILNGINYAILRAKDYSTANSTILFCHPELHNPYMFVLDEFILIISFNDNDLKTGIKYLDKEIEKSKVNTAIKGETIRSIEPEILDKFQKSFYDEAANRFILNLKEDLDAVYGFLGYHGNMPEHIKNEIIEKIVGDKSEKIGVKYTIKHKAKVIKQVLSQHKKK